jgi:hypothetical protein
MQKCRLALFVCKSVGPGQTVRKKASSSCWRSGTRSVEQAVVRTGYSRVQQGLFIYSEYLFMYGT